MKKHNPITAFGATDLGIKAEDFAAQYVRQLGWTILGRNIKVGASEIDLLALDGDTLVVLEVRARTAGGLVSAAQSVGPSKKKALIRGAQKCWEIWAPQAESVRFDVLALTHLGDARFAAEHFVDAFRPTH